MMNEGKNWRRQQFEKFIKQAFSIGFQWGARWNAYNVATISRKAGNDRMADAIEKLVAESDTLKQEADRVRGEVFKKVGIDLGKMSYKVIR